MAAAFLLFIFLQALLYATCLGGACVGEWSTETTKYRTLNFRDDSYVHVSCRFKHLKVDGEQTIKCVDGQLPTYLPQCVMGKVCIPLKAPAFGSMNCTSEAPEVGSACTFECQNTHYLRGTSIRICVEDLRWTGSLARCIMNPECPAPPPLHQGTVTGCSPERKPKYDDTCYFSCNDGFRLVGPSRLKCRLNGKLTDERGRQGFPRCLPSTPVNPSVGATTGDRDFQNRPRPVSPTSWLSCQVYNGYCSQDCHQEPTGIRCSCKSGYRLFHDGKTCIDVDECRNKTLNKCDHHCWNTVGSFKCGCQLGYTLSDGFRCEKAFPSVAVTPSNEDFGNTPRPFVPPPRMTCQEHNGYCSHLCRQEPLGVRCDCKNGYRLSRDGRTCVDVDECQNEAVAKCDHLCQNTVGSFKCLCRKGYTSPDGFRCEDVDECLDNTLNKCGHDCLNTDGGYTCSCREGFVSPDGFRCEGCRVNSYRSITDVSCKECPADSHTDGEEKTSINDCVCNTGFTGNPGQGTPCKDIDECADGEKFGCSHTCINTPGSAHCACPLGYQLKEDGKTCIDINECSIKNGGCDGICHNTLGNFTCSCLQGYVASTHDKYSCEDVDECAEGNGGCSDECVNFKGGFHCFCSEGYHLHPDGKSCIPVYCPRVSVPHHSTLRCKNSTTSDKVIFRPGEMSEDEEFSVGASCRIKCDKGYDFQDSHPGIVCQNDGKWNSSLPECRVLECQPLIPPPNGDVYPSSCKNGSSAVKQKCVFTCQPGYRITGQEVLTCRNNLRWSKKKPVQCVPETEVSISCPDDDITVELKSDEGWAEMQLNSPRTTLAAGPIRVSPEWVTLDRESIFPAGETEVTFSVTRGNKTAECSMSVIVLDKHPPVFPDCPDTLLVSSSIAGTVVSWEEPVPQDNVGIASVSKSLEPNSTLSPGLHFVEYVARDFAGNVGQCIFHINVTASGGCKDLADPEKGEANCQEWMFGKICQPTCFDNYTRPSELFACDETGTWTPSDLISPCLPECPEDETWFPQLQKCKKMS